MSAVKVLVTGATGFIGNYVIHELLKHNVEIIATARSKEHASGNDWFQHVQFISFDFTNFNASENYFEYFNKPDIVIHLAWQGLPNYKSDFHLTENLPRQFAFLQNIIKHGLKSLTVTGTCFEYGMKQGILSEDMDTEPANPYAKAKDELRKQLTELKKQNDFSFKWVRLFYMYGKGQNPNSLFSQLDRAIENKDEIFNMSGGEQIRDFLPVEKVAENIVSIALQNNVEGIINCCSGTPVRIKDLVKEYAESKNSSIKFNLGYYPYPDYEPMEFWGSTEKLNKVKAYSQHH